MSDSNWHYSQGSQTFGPVSLAKLQALCTRGTVVRSTLVWTDGMPDWIAAESILRLWVEPALSAVRPATVNYLTPELGTIRYAGFWKRLVAHLIDWIVTAVIGTVVGSIFYAVPDITRSAGGHHSLRVHSVTGAVQGLA